MTKKQLEQHLNKLREELNNTSNLDDNSKERLELLISDIKNILENSDEKTEEEKESLMENLKESTINFDTKHPELSESINIIIHTLSNMGI